MRKFIYSAEWLTGDEARARFEIKMARMMCDVNIRIQESDMQTKKDIDCRNNKQMINDDVKTDFVMQ